MITDQSFQPQTRVEQIANLTLPYDKRGKLENAISSGPRDDATAEKRDDMAVLTGLALPIRESTQTKGIFVFFDGTMPPPPNFLHTYEHEGGDFDKK